MGTGRVAWGMTGIQSATDRLKRFTPRLGRLKGGTVVVWNPFQLSVFLSFCLSVCLWRTIFCHKLNSVEFSRFNKL